MGTLDGNSATRALVSELRVPYSEAASLGIVDISSRPAQDVRLIQGGQRNYRCLYVTSISFLRVADPGKPSSVQP